MQTAAQDGTSYFSSIGCNALRHRYATLPGVSLPSRVVRSIIATASFSPCILAAALMLRLANAAARSSAMTWSTVGTCRNRVSMLARTAMAELMRSQGRCQSPPLVYRPVPWLNSAMQLKIAVVVLVIFGGLRLIAAPNASDEG